MSSARLVRSTKSRFVFYICAVLAFGIVMYMFHGSQIQLDDNKKALSSCKLQTESLSAQLQVIFEYKLRLERSLQKEKLEHKRSKDECQTKTQQDKEDHDRDLVEASNKYNALLQNTNLIKSKQKDLEDQTSELRKKNLKLLDDLEVQKKNHNGKLAEEQQLRSDREKAIERAKTRNLELEVKLNRLTEENEKLKKERQPESARVLTLEKANVQLERELNSAKSRLDLCLGGDKEAAAEKKSSVGGVGENPAAAEPPKFYYLNKQGSNSTTPVINPEAVIEHDASSPKPSLSKSTKTMATSGDANKKLTQAAAPLQSPDKQPEVAVGPAPAPDEMEANRQIPLPNEADPPQPRQAPETNVIKRPDYSERSGGGEAERGIAGPMNPIQEPAANAIPGQSKLEAAKNKVLNAIQWEEEGGQNGAHEEGEEEAAPPHQPGWRVGGEEAENNKVLPRHMSHDYQGMEYEKDNQEEEEDEEGEQMDYLGGERAPRHGPKQTAKLRQFDRNAEAGGGIMLNPK